MRAATSYQRSLAMLCFAVLAAGDFWRYLLSWWGWGALAVLVVVLSVVELVRARVDLRRMPFFLLLFLAFAAASIAWSAYPGASALGVLLTLGTTAVAAFLATCLSWEEVLETFSGTMRWVLGLSLVFEFVVAVFVRRPVLPFWVDYSELDRIPAAFYWSRNLLFEGGRIQGVVGNANLLGMLALLALIAFALRLAARKGSPVWGGFWIALAVAILALTRSSTVVVATVAVVLVAAFLWVVRRTTRTARLVVFASGAALALGGGAAAVLARGPLLELLGKSSDLTNRLDIWGTVGALAAERPVVGWGWVSYWVPWVDPFDDLIVIKGVTYLQAHNAWLDVFLQLGAIGLAIFALFVLGTLVRGWGMAAEIPRIRYCAAQLRWPETAAPLLLLVALLVQSLAESRLLIEIGFALLVVIAVKTGWRDPERTEAVRG
ncbi:MAG: O-antigen ligase family protein [Protaetiibacter sp.]